MNTLNDEDEDTSKRVHAFVRRIVNDNAKHKILAGSYHCADDDGESAALHGFLGTLILQCTIQIEVARRMPSPNPGHVTQEVSRICNAKHIATRRMQEFIFPPEIVQEMDAADYRDNRGSTPSALYTSIKAVITLMNGLNGTIEAGAIHGVCVASVCVAIINMNPMSNTSAAEPPPSSTTHSTAPATKTVNPPS
jgi:hypothetical protein